MNFQKQARVFLKNLNNKKTRRIFLQGNKDAKNFDNFILVKYPFGTNNIIRKYSIKNKKSHFKNIVNIQSHIRKFLTKKIIKDTRNPIMKIPLIQVDITSMLMDNIYDKNNNFFNDNVNFKMNKLKALSGNNNRNYNIENLIIKKSKGNNPNENYINNNIKKDEKYDRDKSNFTLNKNIKNNNSKYNSLQIKKSAFVIRKKVTKKNLDLFYILKLQRNIKKFFFNLNKNRFLSKILNKDKIKSNLLKTNLNIWHKKILSIRVI
jgi:hypothetical protein